jgi:hypothetical protein
LIYFERSGSGTVGFFEIGASTFDKIMERTLNSGEEIQISVVPRSFGDRGRDQEFEVDVIEDLESVFCYKQEFVLPDFGSVYSRYYFSDDKDSYWEIDSKKLDDIKYKSNKVLDYCVGDRIKELTDVIVKMNSNIIIQPDFDINQFEKEIGEIAKKVVSKEFVIRRC